MVETRTQLIAWIGLVVSIGAFAVSLSALEEERDVDFTLVARANQRDYTNEGFGVRLTLVNESLRPVIVTKVSLLFEDFLLARTSGYLSDVRALDTYSIDPGRVTEERRDLPITIPARTAQTVALLFPLNLGHAPGLTAGGKSQEELEDYQRRFNDHRAAFRLFLANHDIRAKAQVRLLRQPKGIEVKRIEQFGAMTLRYDWFTTLRGTPERPTAITIARKLGGKQLDLARVRVWDTDGQMQLSDERPLRGSAITAFPLPVLSEGSSSYAFIVKGDVVEAGLFSVPVGCTSYIESLLCKGLIPKADRATKRGDRAFRRSIEASRRLGIDLPEYYDRPGLTGL